MNNTNKAEEYEICVICGKITSVPVSMPVDLRDNYAIGVGQICIECAGKLNREQSDQ